MTGIHLTAPNVA